MTTPPPFETLFHSVAQRLANERLDVGLTIAGLAPSRSQAQKWVADQKVWVNGTLEKASYKLQVGDQIEVHVLKKPDIELVPYPLDLDIVFEDDTLLVVNKPAGLVVHPAAGHPDDTLVNALIARDSGLSGGSASYRPGLVHRIDKGTSGLLVVAKNEECHAALAKQFLKKTTHRRYFALCFGCPTEKTGTIKSYLSRDPKNRKRFVSSPDEGGKLAITHYTVLQTTGPLSLLALQLETGRTHQIRVHLSALNHPIVGDDTYNGKKRAKNLKSQKLKKMILEMDRFALHAGELGFHHPQKNEVVTFRCPFPPELNALFDLAGIVTDALDF